jgi:hypothetical protein
LDFFPIQELIETDPGGGGFNKNRFQLRWH